MRNAVVKRSTKETDISASVNLDGTGISNINTGIGFLDHMITSFSRHSLIDIQLTIKGDLHVDAHHTVEDAGIVLGQAIRSALTDKSGITRYGFASIPMDEALTQCSIDLGGRAHLVLNCNILYGPLGQMDFEDVREFVTSFTQNLQANVHINVLYGTNRHHVAESIFKALARSIRQAVKLDAAESGVPSSKGMI